MTCSRCGREGKYAFLCVLDKSPVCKFWRSCARRWREADQEARERAIAVTLDTRTFHTDEHCPAIAARRTRSYRTSTLAFNFTDLWKRNGRGYIFRRCQYCR